MMAAPRPAIFGMKTSVFQSGSVIMSWTDSPLLVA
jgi:hypothetical protein